MNRELELLVLAYDALLESHGNETKAATAAFESKVDDALERHPGISGDTLRRMIVLAHRGSMPKECPSQCHQKLNPKAK